MAAFRHALASTHAHIHGATTTGSDDFFLGSEDALRSKDTLAPSEQVVRARVVPALKSALEKETNNDIVTAALIALAKIGEVKREDGTTELVPLFARFLADSNQEIAETAALSLGILANEAAIPVLTELARDDASGRKRFAGREVPYRTRAFATYGLGLIGNRSASNTVRQDVVRTLIGLLDKPDAAQRDVKVAALIAIGIVPLDADRGDGIAGRASAADSRRTQLEWLGRFFEDEKQHSLLRAHAPTAIARLLAGAPAEQRVAIAKRLLQPLERHAKERDEVVQSCVLALGQISDADDDEVDVVVRKALIEASQERDIQTRHFALIALGQIGGRAGASKGEAEGAQQIRSHLLTSLTKGAAPKRPWAALAIGVMERARSDAGLPVSTGAAVAKQALRSALRDCVQASDLGAYAIALAIARDLEAQALLGSKLAQISDPTAQGYVAVSLGMLGARDSIESIQALVRRSKYKPELLRQAAIGLGLLGDKTVVPELLQMMRDAKSQAVHAATASGLGMIGDARSIDPLVGMLENLEITPTSRGFAAAALGIVADKESLPWSTKISLGINYRATTSTLFDSGRGILEIL
ncbi:MAG: HEAT repeat domain-containing protein [Planctomycetota bacterium]